MSMGLGGTKRDVNGGTKSFTMKGTDDSKQLMKNKKGVFHKEIKPIKGKTAWNPEGLKKEEKKVYFGRHPGERGRQFSTDQLI